MMRTIGIEYPAVGQIAFCELGPPPDPGPTQVLLETLYSAITNGTERHALLHEHGYGTFPGRHGYQHVARVVAAGEAVRGLAVGDVLFYGGYVGHRGWHLVEPAADPLFVRLGDDLDQAECALLGVAGVGLRAVRRTRVGVDSRVWVVGQGLIGQFCAQCARAAGAEVTVSDPLVDRLERAGASGLVRRLDARAEDHVAALQAGAPYTHILDCSGREDLLPFCWQHRLLGFGTVIGLIAVRGETRFPWTMLHGAQASIEVSCHFGPDDLTVLTHLLREDKLRVRPLISHQVPIDDALDLYAVLRDAPGELLGVVLDWRS